MRRTPRRRWFPGSDEVKVDSGNDSLCGIGFDTYNWDLRPNLGALLWDDGEAHHIVF